MSEKSGVTGQVLPLPTGGGALQGIGETFSPDLFTGTGNVTVPIAVPPGRNGFQPALTLAYSTGTGNGPFGLGWQLGTPAIVRKTSRGVPRYRDETDTFLLAGVDDLVPVGAGRYRPSAGGRVRPDRAPAGRLAGARPGRADQPLRRRRGGGRSAGAGPGVRLAPDRGHRSVRQPDRLPVPPGRRSALPGHRPLRRPRAGRPHRVPGVRVVRLPGAPGPVRRAPRRVRDRHPAALHRDRGAHPPRRRAGAEPQLPAALRGRAGRGRRPRPGRPGRQRRLAARPDRHRGARRGADRAAAAARLRVPPVHARRRLPAPGPGRPAGPLAGPPRPGPGRPRRRRPAGRRRDERLGPLVAQPRRRRLRRAAADAGDAGRAAAGRPGHAVRRPQRQRPHRPAVAATRRILPAQLRRRLERAGLRPVSHRAGRAVRRRQPAAGRPRRGRRGGRAAHRPVVRAVLQRSGGRLEPRGDPAPAAARRVPGRQLRRPARAAGRPDRRRPAGHHVDRPRPDRLLALPRPRPVGPQAHDGGQPGVPRPDPAARRLRPAAGADRGRGRRRSRRSRLRGRRPGHRLDQPERPGVERRRS